MKTLLKNTVCLLASVVVFSGCTPKQSSDKTGDAALAAGLSFNQIGGLVESISMGGETGNGGGALVCRNATTGAIEKVEVLDLYEARVIRNLVLDMGPADLAFEQKIENVLAKLAKVSPLRAAQYTAMYKRFFDEAVMIPDANLKYIDDAANVVVPVGCTKEQASIMQNPEFPGDPRYTMSKNLWDKMDNNSKAALVLHEIIYQEGLSEGQNNSKPTRFLVGKLTSNQAAGLTSESFAALLDAAGFKSVDLLGTLIIVTKYDDGSGRYYRESDSTFFKDVVKPAEITYAGMTLVSGFYISFDKNNNPTTVYKMKNLKRNMIELLPVEGVLYGATFAANGKMTGLGLVKKSGSDAPAPSLGLIVNGAVGIGRFGEIEVRMINDSFGLRLDENEKPFSWSGLIQIKNLATGFQSGQLLSDEASDARTILENGFIPRAKIYGTQAFQTPQGPKKFRATINSDYDYSAYVAFDPATGLVLSGPLAPSEEINLVDGRKKKWLYPMAIRFVNGGLAEMIPRYFNANPDNIEDGCDIMDFSPIVPRIAEVLKKSLAENKIDWLPETLKIVRIADYTYKPDAYLDLVYSQPNFSVKFKNQLGLEYSVEMAVNSFSDSTAGGITLSSSARLITDRNTAGQVSRHYCMQGISGVATYDIRVYLVDQYSRKTNLGYAFDSVAPLIEERPLN